MNKSVEAIEKNRSQYFGIQCTVTVKNEDVDRIVRAGMPEYEDVRKSPA